MAEKETRIVPGFFLTEILCKISDSFIFFFIVFNTADCT